MIHSSRRRGSTTFSPEPLPAVEATSFRAGPCFQKALLRQELPTSKGGRRQSMSTRWLPLTWSSGSANRGSSRGSSNLIITLRHAGAWSVAHPSYETGREGCEEWVPRHEVRIRAATVLIAARKSRARGCDECLCWSAPHVRVEGGVDQRDCLDQLGNQSPVHAQGKTPTYRGRR